MTRKELYLFDDDGRCGLLLRSQPDAANGSRLYNVLFLDTRVTSHRLSRWYVLDSRVIKLSEVIDRLHEEIANNLNSYESAEGIISPLSDLPFDYDDPKLKRVRRASPFPLLVR